jgi:hypothetical protein
MVYVSTAMVYVASSAASWLVAVYGHGSSPVCVPPPPPSAPARVWTPATTARAAHPAAAVTTHPQTHARAPLPRRSPTRSAGRFTMCAACARLRLGAHRTLGGLAALQQRAVEHLGLLQPHALHRAQRVQPRALLALRPQLAPQRRPALLRALQLRLSLRLCSRTPHTACTPPPSRTSATCWTAPSRPTHIWPMSRTLGTAQRQRVARLGPQLLARALRLAALLLRPLHRRRLPRHAQLPPLPAQHRTPRRHCECPTSSAGRRSAMNRTPPRAVCDVCGVAAGRRTSCKVSTRCSHSSRSCSHCSCSLASQRRTSASTPPISTASPAARRRASASNAW